MSSEKRIDTVIHNSLYTATSYLVLSQMETLLDAQQRLARAWASPPAGKRERVGGLISESTSLPWSDQAAQVLYWHLMEALTFHELQTLLYSASHPGGANVTADNSLLAEVLERIRFAPLILTRGRPDREAMETLLQAYLADTCTPAELRKLHLPRNLALEDRFALLQLIWRCRTGWSASEALAHHTRLWVWLTQVDHVLAYSAKERREVVRGLEVLVEKTGRYLTLWLGLEAEEVGVIKEMKAALGPKLLRFLDVDLTTSVVESVKVTPVEPEGLPE